MASKRDTFCLFFPQLGLDATDRANLLTSTVKRVYLHFNMAHRFPLELQWLAQQGRRVVLRIEEPNHHNAGEIATSYYNSDTHPSIKSKLEQMMRVVSVEAVTIGNEPEHEFNLTRGHPWGNEYSEKWRHWKGKVGVHSEAIGRLAFTLKDMPVQLVSPGWTHKRKVPKDPPEPGRADWARTCTVAYNKLQGGGIHLYGHGAETLYENGEDYNRLLWSFGHELERVHTKPWVLEINTAPNKGSELEHMRWVCRMYEVLTGPEHSMGNDLAFYCPFTSNGIPGEAWPQKFLMRDPACYAYLAEWLSR